MSDTKTLMLQMIETAAKAEWAATWDFLPWETASPEARLAWMKQTQAGLLAILPMIETMAVEASNAGLTAAFNAMEVEYAVQMEYGDGDQYTVLTPTKLGLELDEAAATKMAKKVEGVVVTRRVTRWAVGL